MGFDAGRGLLIFKSWHVVCRKWDEGSFRFRLSLLAKGCPEVKEKNDIGRFVCGSSGDGVCLC